MFFPLENSCHSCTFLLNVSGETDHNYLLDLLLAASSDIRHQPILLDVSFSVNWLEILSSSSVKWNRLYTLKFSKSKVKKSLSH